MLVLACFFLLGARGAAPKQLDSSTFAHVRAYAAPTAKDLSFQSIDWKNTVFDGLVAAQKEDKPLLLWMYFGDPRGHC